MLHVTLVICPLDRFCPIYIQFQKCFVYVWFHLSREKKIKYVLQLDETAKCYKIKICLVFEKMAMNTVSNYTHIPIYTHTHQIRCKYLMMGQRKRAIMWKIYCFKNLKERNSSAIWSNPHLSLIVGTHCLNCTQKPNTKNQSNEKCSQISNSFDFLGHNRDKNRWIKYVRIYFDIHEHQNHRTKSIDGSVCVWVTSEWVYDS